MSAPTSVRIELCGRFVVELDGRRLERKLPGRQGRLLVAYLATRRGRPMSRDELIAALWPADLPADPEKSLGVLLSKCGAPFRAG
jgi:DNA-binding SARP family transcriptional activator